jgi:hypothetical protein
MKKRRAYLKEITNNITDKLFSKIPDSVTGRKKYFEKEFFILYGLRNVENEIVAMKKNNFNRYLSILVLFIIFTIMACFSSTIDEKKLISVDSEGRTYFERPTENQGTIKIPLIVYGKVGDQPLEKVLALTIKPEGTNNRLKEETQKEKMDPEIEALESINQFIRTINKSDSGKLVYLPNEISGIDNIVWKTKESNLILTIIIFGTIGLILAYLGRYNAAKKLKAKCDESITRELPEFLNKIVLLMNAGLVLTAAFERIMQDYDTRKFGNQSYFYNQLEEIHINIVQVNCSMIVELKMFAERSRNREFMRLTNIMADNLNKGTELVDKLQSESAFLWFERKKRAEEKGRLAETKLTMPLAIQLLVLIMITVAPALMEM